RGYIADRPERSHQLGLQLTPPRTSDAAFEVPRTMLASIFDISPRPEHLRREVGQNVKTDMRPLSNKPTCFLQPLQFLTYPRAFRISRRFMRPVGGRFGQRGGLSTRAEDLVNSIIASIAGYLVDANLRKQKRREASSVPQTRAWHTVRRSKETHIDLGVAVVRELIKECSLGVTFEHTGCVSTSFPFASPHIINDINGDSCCGSGACDLAASPT
ncbi:hypothetical protein THAOC_32709, partial [Thalassiosira oceanica]